ncbi:PREDICTED: vacuolar-sorting receptor 2-like [Brassica oleracea var. oleracea]|nr:PREDICTED: vacuolar-sorting receptor 2-like [Brassica oleracea var. oleracea]
MGSKTAQMLTSARRKQCASVAAANARTHGEAMNVAATEACFTSESNICISKDARGDVSWGVIWIIIMGLGAAALGAYTVYKYRIRTYMDSEIRAIMAEYMPLDNHPNTQPCQLEL